LLFLDIVLGLGTNSFNLRFTLPSNAQKIVIRDLVVPFSLVYLLDQAKGQEVLLHIEKEGVALPIGAFSSPIELTPGLRQLTGRVMALWSLVCDLGADSGATFSLSDIYEISLVAELLLAARHEQRWILVDIPVLRDSVDLNRPVSIITNPLIRIGSLQYGEVVMFSGLAHILKEDESKTWIRVKSPQLQTLKSLQFSTAQATGICWDEVFGRARAALGGEGASNVITRAWHEIWKRAS
jgi:hypothetical protein